MRIEMKKTTGQNRDIYLYFFVRGILLLLFILCRICIDPFRKTVRILAEQISLVESVLVHATAVNIPFASTTSEYGEGLCRFVTVGTYTIEFRMLHLETRIAQVYTGIHEMVPVAMRFYAM